MFAWTRTWYAMSPHGRMFFNFENKKQRDWLCEKGFMVKVSAKEAYQHQYVKIDSTIGAKVIAHYKQLNES